MPVVQALEQQAAIEASSVPHMEEDGRRQVLRDLSRQLAVLRPAPPTREQLLAQIKEHDPDKAIAWFEALGVRVIGHD